MNYQICNIKNEKSADYAKLTVYMLDDSPEIAMHKRPCVIVCPGGGYVATSDREAEIIALQFTAMGYHAAVLRYSHSPAAVFPTALRELAASVALVRERAEEWHVDADAILVCGFSAGGHLVASLGTMWHEAWLSESLQKTAEDIQPNAMILGYPVISSGIYAHRASFINLLGDDYEAKKDELSLEKRVSKHTPATFIWGTFEDTLVPVENSLLFVSALAENKVSTEYHMFQKGAHGLALADRSTQPMGGSVIEPAAAEWIRLVHMWVERFLQE
ncbi:MAG: alpha/beta hydrolase [Faecalimonas sp.]|nr:alpha/beta hydrolase [Faecalimonas sp.]